VAKPLALYAEEALPIASFVHILLLRDSSLEEICFLNKVDIGY
jgi:hypothetical protein